MKRDDIGRLVRGLAPGLLEMIRTEIQKQLETGVQQQALTTAAQDERIAVLEQRLQKLEPRGPRKVA